MNISYLGARSLGLASTLLLGAFFGQAYAQQAPMEYVTIDSSDARTVTLDPAALEATCTVSEEPVLIIGDNEEDENHFFTLVRGMGRLSNGSVVAVDRRAAEIRVFDNAGRHVRSMGRRGEAPGEFLNPYILWVGAGDTLWVGDYRPWRYNVFTAEGQFVRRVTLDPVYANPSGGGGVLDNGYTVNEWTTWDVKEDFSVHDTMFVEIHDPAGRLLGTLAKLPDVNRGKVKGSDTWYHPLFASFAEIDARGSTIVLAHGSKAEVRVLDDEFNLRTIIRWSEPDPKVTRAHIRMWREDYIERRSYSARQARNDPRLSQDRPAADFFPAMSSVTIGRDGRIWIKQYSRPREKRGWLVFDSDGQFSCRVHQLPGDPWEFGADYVLLLHESDSEPETIRMYRLTTPSR